MENTSDTSTIKFFFVRHGESLAASLGNHSVPNTNILSPAGNKQALVLAERLSGLPIEMIAASTSGRAKETAEIINETLRVPIEFADILRERDCPSEFRGKSFDDPDVVRIEALRVAHKYETDWRFSDEETFTELKARALNILVYLKKFSKKEILVVAHAEIIKTIIAVMMFGENMTPQEFNPWFSFAKTHNTGVTECLWDNEKKIWKLISWNDLRHLG